MVVLGRAEIRSPLVTPLQPKSCNSFRGKMYQIGPHLTWDAADEILSSYQALWRTGCQYDRVLMCLAHTWLAVQAFCSALYRLPCVVRDGSGDIAFESRRCGALVADMIMC